MGPGKGLAAIILAKKPMMGSEDKEMDDVEQGERDAAAEIMDAVRKGDSDMLHESLKSFITMCFHRLQEGDYGDTGDEGGMKY